MLTASDLQKLSADAKKLSPGTAGLNLKGVSSLSFKFSISVSKFGEPVSFQPPASFKPLDQLLGSLVGGATTLPQPQPGGSLAAHLSVSWRCPPNTVSASVTAQSGKIDSVRFSLVSGGKVLAQRIVSSAPFTSTWSLKGLPKSFTVRAEIAGSGKTLTLEQTAQNCTSA